MAKILGIDYGDSKIGLALADTQVKIALPYKVVGADKLMSDLRKIVAEEIIEKIIVGLPLNFSGKETDQTKKTRQFIKALSQEFSQEIILEDERLTTAQAERFNGDDSQAASLILQSYLDRQYG
jgi:putative holliday junction resolvase